MSATTKRSALLVILLVLVQPVDLCLSVGFSQ